MSRSGAGHAQEECLEVSSARRSRTLSCPHLYIPTMSCSGTLVLPSLPHPAWDQNQEQNLGPETSDQDQASGTTDQDHGQEQDQDKDQLVKGCWGWSSLATRTSDTCPCGQQQERGRFSHVPEPRSPAASAAVLPRGWAGRAAGRERQSRRSEAFPWTGPEV